MYKYILANHGRSPRIPDIYTCCRALGTTRVCHSQDSNPRPPACEVNVLPIVQPERRFIQIKKRTNCLTNVFSCCVDLINHNVDIKQDYDVTFGHSSYDNYQMYMYSVFCKGVITCCSSLCISDNITMFIGTVCR